jgi:hypothetical protein
MSTTDIIFYYVFINTPAQFRQLLFTQRKQKKMSIKDITSVYVIGNRFISELENGKETARLNKSLGYCVSIIGLDNKNKAGRYGAGKKILQEKYQKLLESKSIALENANAQHEILSTNQKVNLFSHLFFR